MDQHTPATYIIRRSFTLLIFRIVVMEILLEGIYVLWRLSIDYFSLSPNTKIALHGFTTVIFICVTLMQLLFFITVVVRWLNEYYEIQEDEIIQWVGIFSRKGKSYPYSNIQSISIQQSWFARLLGYGSVSLYVPALGQDLNFNEVPKPFAFVELIKQNMPKGDSQRFLFRKK